MLLRLTLTLNDAAATHVPVADDAMLFDRYVAEAQDEVVEN